MPDGPDEPHRHTLVGPAPRASAPDEGRQTVPMERFQPPPSPVPDDDQNTVLARPTGAAPAPWRPPEVTASVGQGAFQPPRPRAPTLQGPGHPPAPAAPEPFGAALSLTYGGPPPAPAAAPPQPRSHRRALLALAFSTTTLAVALFAVSIVLHVKRRPRAAPRADAPAVVAPAVTAAAALTPAPPPPRTPAPAAPTAAPPTPAPPPAAPPPAPVAAAEEPADDDAHHHRRRHGRERSPGRHRRRNSADTLLWGAP